MRRLSSSCVLIASLLACPAWGTEKAHPEGERSAEPEPDCEKSRTFWRRVSDPQAAKYCATLQRGESRLYSEPGAALNASREAKRLFPSGRAALVLEAQALLLSGKPAEAHERFQKVITAAGKTTPVFSHVVPLMNAARAALLSASYDIALGHYRQLVLRLPEVPDAREQTRLLIEAATAAMYAGPDHGAEARAYLATASGKNAPLLMPIVRAAWALSFVRDRDPERARSHASHFESSWHVRWIFDERPPRFGLKSEVLPVLPPGEGLAYSAAIALLVEPDATQIHFQEFLEAATNHLPEHLRLIPPR